VASGAHGPAHGAAALGLLPFTLAVVQPVWPAAVELGLVETAGGVRSPLAADGDCAAFTHALDPDQVVLVADAGLDTINSVRLSAEALAPLPLRVLLNRFDPTIDLHRRNRAWLHDADGFEVLTTADAGWERSLL